MTIRFFLLTSVCLLFAGTAMAQDPTQTTTGAGATSTVDITINANVGTAITLTVSGGTDDGSSATTALTNVSGNTAELDFGTVYTITGAPSTGERVRVSTGTAGAGGAHFVGTLDVYVEVSGVADATLSLEKTGAANGNLRFATGDATDWSTQPSGTPVPTLGGGSGNLGGAVLSEETVECQVALYVPDTQAAAAVSETVRFTAVADP